MKTTIIALAIFFAFVLLFTGCNEPQSYDDRTHFDQDRYEQWERDRERAIEDEKPKLDDTDQFWEWRMPDSQPAPSPSPIPDAGVAGMYKDAVYREQNNPDAISDVFSVYASLALTHPEVLSDAKRAFKKLTTDKEATVLWPDSVIDLAAAYPTDREINRMLHTVHARSKANLLKELKEAKYNLAVRYTHAFQQSAYKNKRYEDMPNDCMYDSSGMQELTRLAEAIGDKSEARFWTLRTADYLATNHGCENPGEDHWSAYFLYVKAGDDANAKSMALLVADYIFDIYVNGLVSEWYPDRLMRHPWLPYDLQFTKEWLSKAGLSEAKADIWMKEHALKSALASEKGCRSAEPSILNPCELSKKQYEFVGDGENAARMALLAPKPK